MFNIITKPKHEQTGDNPWKEILIKFLIIYYYFYNHFMSEQ